MGGVVINSTDDLRTELDGPVNLHKQSAAKVWCTYDASSTPVISESFNCSSITDNGTGDQTTSYTNSMNTTTYSLSGSCFHATSGRPITFGAQNSLKLTGSVRARTIDATEVFRDTQNASPVVHGDLA